MAVSCTYELMAHSSCKRTHKACTKSNQPKYQHGWKRSPWTLTLVWGTIINWWIREAGESVSPWERDYPHSSRWFHTTAHVGITKWTECFSKIRVLKLKIQRWVGRGWRLIWKKLGENMIKIKHMKFSSNDKNRRDEKNYRKLGEKSGKGDRSGIGEEGAGSWFVKTHCMHVWNPQ